MRLSWCLPGVLGTFLLALPAHAGGKLIYWRFNEDSNRLEIVTEKGVRPKANIVAAPARIVIDLPNTQLGRPRTEERLGRRIRYLRVGQFTPKTTRLVVELHRKYWIEPKAVKVRGLTTNRWYVQLPRPRKMRKAERRRRREQKQILAITVPPPKQSITSNRPGRPSRPTRPSRPSPASRPSRRNVTVILDPGHGGRDPGAVGIGGLQEKRVVLPISQEVARILRSKGIKVVMTRNRDAFISLQGRVNIAERSRGRIFVSIHANAVGNRRSSVNGVETYYFQTGRRLAQSIQNSILRRIQIRNRGVRQARFFVIRRTSMPATLVEVGFVTGRQDAAKLRQPAFRKKMANAIAIGILNYLGIRP